MPWLVRNAQKCMNQEMLGTENDWYKMTLYKTAYSIYLLIGTN